MWNQHNIRRTKQAHAPSGRPNIMYDVPSLYGTRDYLHPIPEDEIRALEGECTFRSSTPVDPDVENMCFHMMREHNVGIPKTPSDATDLYTFLRQELLRQL